VIDKTIPLEEIQIRIRSIEEDVRTLKRVIENAFLCISSFNSYAAGWIRVFSPSIYNRYREC
jgi:ribonuclease PH